MESAKKNNRTRLQAANELAKMKPVALIIPKLDRLSRNAAFIFTVRDSGVRIMILRYL